MISRIGACALLLLAACSPSKPSNEGGNAESNVAAPLPPSARPEGVSANPAPTVAASLNVSRFTADGLDKCRLIAKNEEEGPYYRHRCPGIGGFDYEVVEHDLRQELVIIGPGGRRSELCLSRVAGGGGFNVLGATFDWRGPAGAPPRTVTVRSNVNEDPEPNAPARSYLIVIQLKGPACPVAAIAPGPTQSTDARRIADSEPLPPCLR